MKKIFLSLAALMPLAAGAATPLWLRDVKISPDGRSVAFCYKGDIYTVPVTGGKATRLTATDDYEASPVWSPDSRMIAYATDRNGNFDVYVIDADGGTPRRLTVNSAAEIPESFTPDGKAVLYSAAIQDPVGSALFPSARMTELYSVPVSGGAPVQVLGTPARFVSWTDDGKSFLYQDVKGFENEWRKHHTSSVTRDIWLYDSKTGKHTNLTARGGEDTEPVAGEGGTFYFLSERDGLPVNVYKASVSDPQSAVALTGFKTHPVRFLSRADDGRMAMTWDGEIYTMAEGGKPVRLAIDVIDDSTPQTAKLPVRTGAREAVPSPDGKSVAFVWRGNVFVTSVEYPTTKQITTTPAAESDVCWSPDSKTLYYTTERDGLYNIYKAEMARADEEPDFAHATVIKEGPVFTADRHERTVPQVSPDGKKLAFILDRNILAVKDLKSGKVTRLTNGETYQHRDGRFNYTWSPDSKWIALEIVDRMRDPYTDIAIINAETGQRTNLTNSGYFDAEPRWVMGGDAIMFASERYGMRNHASWGSQMDVMLVFVNRDAYDRWQLSEEDHALLKDAEKDKDKDKKDKDADADKSADDINVELDGITDRIVRVTPMSTYLHDAVMTADGETLYYLTDGDDGKQLWKFKPREDEHKLVTTVAGSPSFETSKDGKTIFLLGSSMRKLDPKSDKLTPITYSATMPIDYAAEREFMFDNMAREEAARFYIADMHGVDWPAMTKAYRRFLPHINNNYDFAEMLSEILGELNVSHTGGRFAAPSGSGDDRTASLGLLYDLSYTGKGLRIAEVVERGPLATARSKAAPGVIVEKIDGIEITPGTDMAELLTDRSGKRTLISMHNPATGERWDETVKPISTGAMSGLLYDRWVKQRAADVDRMSNGRLGYVHIESMDDESFRRVYSDLLGKYNDREGVVIDIRWNGGGRLHEDIEVLFSGKKYFTQEIRGTKTCDMPSRRWNKPSIMVMSEACYSNAHGTPWVYSHQGIGKLVGMPVPGTMTSVNWVRMQDPSLIFGIPVIGYHLPDGSFLENQQLEPDIKVANDPATIVTGVDTQLQTAVDALLRQIDGK
ncbi:MAG: S41 family peptidase [Bacteroidales bacterium]|nr:S41 family peptidase [Bacteroidales bacterium]